jgi:hypothetical protein
VATKPKSQPNANPPAPPEPQTPPAHTPEKINNKNSNFSQKHVQNFHPLAIDIEGNTFFEEKKPESIFKWRF